MDIAERVGRQIDFYFGDINLPRDRFLLDKVSENKDRYVDISVILNLNRMKKLGVTKEFLVDVVRKSEVCEISPDGTQVRRKIPLPSDMDLSVPIPKIFPRKMNYKDSDQHDFSVFCFNMLKQSAVYRSSVKPQYLLIEHRLPMILQELQTHKADIMCLLECDRYLDFKENKELFEDYDSVFITTNIGKQDGMGVFWDKKTLKPLKIYQKPFSTPLPRPLFVCLFLHLPTSQTFLFCSLHLQAGMKAERAKIRMEQINELQIILDFARVWEEESCKNTKKKVPVLICGDFNDSNESKVYERVVDGQGYSSAFGDHKEQYTMYSKFDTLEFISKVTLDYIFYTKELLDVRGLLEIPEDPKSVFPETIPGENYPSDHLAIKAAFSFR